MAIGDLGTRRYYSQVSVTLTVLGGEIDSNFVVVTNEKDITAVEAAANAKLTTEGATFKIYDILPIEFTSDIDDTDDTNDEFQNVYSSSISGTDGETFYSKVLFEIAGTFYEVIISHSEKDVKAVIDHLTATVNGLNDQVDYRVNQIDWLDDYEGISQIIT